MADPTPSGPRKWLWPLVIALLGVLLLIWLINPAGDDDGAVEDPITTPAMGEADTETLAPLDPVADAEADIAETENERMTAPADVPPPPAE